jgi:hypothetical protein
MLFDEPAKMLEIYNALSGRALPPDTPVLPATLEDALFMDRINDLAFVVDGRLVVLIEHQSTINKNMPLRILIYLPRVYEKLLDNKTIYRTGLVKIPKPEFYVLYNGKDDCPDVTTLRLSDAFMDDSGANSFGGMIELEVPVININKGRNTDVTTKSPILSGYVSFITKVRELQASGLELSDAVTTAVNYCVEHGILADTLANISSEVLNMLTVEFNLEDAKKVWFEDGIEEGKAKGEKSRAFAIAKNLLKMNMPIEQIITATNLTREEIENLRDAE